VQLGGTVRSWSWNGCSDQPPPTASSTYSDIPTLTHITLSLSSLRTTDPLVNLVLDHAVEHIRDLDDPYKLTTNTRSIGLIVCRGTTVMLLCPTDGMQEIENPFIQQQEESEQAM